MARRRPTPTAADDAVGWRPQAGLQGSILFDVFVLGQRTRALVGEAMRDAGMRPDEFAVYSVVFEAGSLTLTEMADRLGVPLTTVADDVRAMTERRHLRRTAHPTDGRASLLSLTPEGLRRHRRAARSFERAIDALRAELGPLDEAAARETLQTLAASAERAVGSLTARGAGRAG
jgi:DNA-binding MarR family transcriptional regulator